MVRMLVLVIPVVGGLFLAPSSFPQPVPSTYSWSWEPTEARVRVEAQAFVDFAGSHGACFTNDFVDAPWHSVECTPPPPVFWNWSFLPPLTTPQPPVPALIPNHWDLYPRSPTHPEGPEIGGLFVGDYCPSPSSDAQGNPPPPPPPSCALDWNSRQQFLSPVGQTFHNMLGRPSLMPDFQVQNSVFASDQDSFFPGTHVTGESHQIITVRNKNSTMGGGSMHQGARTWELRMRHVAETEAEFMPGVPDRYVGETAATMVMQVPLEIIGLTPGRTFWMTFDFQLLAETDYESEVHHYLDELGNARTRIDVDNAYALASVNLFDGIGPVWLTQFTEKAGDPPGFIHGTFPPNSTGIGGSWLAITPSDTTHPFGLRMIARVRTQIEDGSHGGVDFAYSSMQANIWLTLFSPPIIGSVVKIDAEGLGPDYDFWISQYEVSNLEFVDFLNDAETDANNPDGSTEKSAFMLFGPDGEVTTPTGAILFEPLNSPVPGGGGTQKIRYRPHLPAGTRYVADPAAETDAVVGVTWIGALKYANWLTLHLGHAPDQRCYTEGNDLQNWHPVTIDQDEWAVRDLSDTERAELVANCRGFRLPMDNLGDDIGFVGNQVNPYNEWYKASAYDPDAPDSDRTGPGGETVPPFHWIYGFGRDTIDDEDANFVDSGDPFDNGVAHIGFFDGVNELADGRTTRDTANHFGLYDMAGNVAEWGQDQGPGIPVGPDPLQTRATRTGAWDSDPSETAASWRDHATPLGTSTRTGFRVLTTFDPSGKLFHDRFEEN